MSTGELNDNKNHAEIIKAVAKLQDEKIHYIIAGRGAKEFDLKNLSKELRLEDRVHILGFRSDVVDLLKAADCFAFPSKREGLGLAAIEAMASGLPLLTSNSGGINDYSIDGMTGYKYEADDVEGFARGIEKLKDEAITRYKFGINAKEISKEFNLCKAEEIMKKVYSFN